MDIEVITRGLLHSGNNEEHNLITGNYQSVDWHHNTKKEISTELVIAEMFRFPHEQNRMLRYSNSGWT